MDAIKKFASAHPILLSLGGSFALLALYHSGKLNSVFSTPSKAILPAAQPTSA